MVNFRKRLAKKDTSKILDPLELYETLDRDSDKGELRRSQYAILNEWHEERRNKRDVIIKLHTGQGKTLIGLLTLQSKLNEDGGPVVYLCPNNFLVNQTSSQAKQFGITHCTIDGGELPLEFLDGKSILITSIQKLFNGRTKFYIGAQSTLISTILMDDAHACIDSIREALRLRIPNDETAYTDIRDLFSSTLQNQGMGTYADICNKNQDAHLLVPYWDWRDKQSEVVGILSKYTDRKSIRFVWPIVKDIISECQCVISGTSLEIVPYLPPLQLFGTYAKAKHRIFMSATVTDDAFLIKGLGLSAETIRNPLVYKEERWSGEKMLLIPSLIDQSLNRSTIVRRFAEPNARRKIGVVALVPSFKGTADWQLYGATVAKANTIDTEIERLKNEDFANTLVIVNRYDGIDLPDKMCRILIFDSQPYSESLVDRYSESCRSTSEITASQTARRIEQGLGRSVRGEKDYCAIVIIGAELVKTIRTRQLRKYLSSQTQAQIQIGIETTDMAREEVEKGAKSLEALNGLITQCLNRDPDWKAFYVEQMDKVASPKLDSYAIEVFQKEVEAERKYLDGDIDGAIKCLQFLVDNHVTDDADRGWYLQEMARYRYVQSKDESNKLQISAHRKNRYLLKPQTGMQISRIAITSQKRMEKIIDWIKSFDNFQELSIALEDILSALTFGVKSDRFEEAFNSLATIIGFAGQRPDKEWKEGPDNLWALRDNEYLLVECKDEVQLTRSEIHMQETEQMNRSFAWFSKNYTGAKSTNIMIIPTNRLASSAAFLCDVRVMQVSDLVKFTTNVRNFFLEFKSLDLRDLSEKKVQDLINTHRLSIDSIISEYSRPVKSHK